MAVLGKSNLDIFPLALGANTFGWTSDEAASHAVLDAFVDGGGNMVDTSDNYTAWIDGHSGGESERVIGSWLTKSGRRSEVIVATKVSQHPDFLGLSAKNVAAAADASLTRLSTDVIDLYFAHYDDADTPLEETVAAFDALVTAGKVRYVGVSNYSADRIREWVAIAERDGFALPVSLQPEYNLVRRGSFEGGLASVAEEFNLGVVPYFALASGFLTGKFRSLDDIRGTQRGGLTEGFFSQEGLEVVDVLSDIANAHEVTISAVSLAWLLSKPTVVAPIASARNPEQLSQLMKVSSLKLAADELDRLDEVSAKVPQ